MKRHALDDELGDHAAIKRLRLDQMYPLGKHDIDDVSVDSAYISQDQESTKAPYSVTKASHPDAVSCTSTSSARRPKTFHCDYQGCDKAFDRPARLTIHKRSHTKERPFVCEEAGCDKTFVRSEHLKAHIKSNHEDTRDHICTYQLEVSSDGTPVLCGKSFHTSTRLRRHVAAHEDKEQTKCQECGQIFRKQETLQRHILSVHMNEKGYRCKHSIENQMEECGEAFATLSQLKAHEAREHSCIRFFCDVCTTQDTASAGAIGFTTYAELQLHLKLVHPPICHICGFASTSGRGLKAHLEIVHQSLTERQRFECTHDGCDKKFTKQGNLNVHIRTVHTQAKPYICGQHDLSNSKNMSAWSGLGCGVGFGTKASLEQHVRTQHLGMPATSHKEERQRVQKVKSDLGISGLTGYGYEDARPVACLEVGCLNRFRQDHDLVMHLELHHGWNIDDINDAIAEVAALQGDKFWLGGLEELQQYLSGE